MAVDGSVTLAGRTSAVTGQAWLDHEWSSELLPADAQGWDWIGINLDDGSGKGIISQAALQIHSAHLDNRGGFLSAKGAVQLLGADAPELDIHWQPFQLDPDADATPVPLREAYDLVIASYKTPIVNLLEVGLVGAVLYHALNGLRVIAVDFWSRGPRYQRQMLWGVVGVWAVVMIPGTYYMMRHTVEALFGATP